MTDYQKVLSEIRDAAAAIATANGMALVDTALSGRTLITLMGEQDRAGQPYHPVRVEIEVWKALDADNNVIEAEA